jgi:hypothetical protein
MERFLAAVRAAAERIIHGHFVGIDDATDIIVHDTDPRLPELVELEAAIEADPQARRAVGFSEHDPVPAGYGVGFMARWLSEYCDLSGHLLSLDDEPTEATLQRLRDFSEMEAFPVVVLTPLHGLLLPDTVIDLDDTTDLVRIREVRDVRRAFDYSFRIPWGTAEWLQPASVTVRQRLAVPRGAAADFSPAMQRAETLLAALRLAEVQGVLAGMHVIEIRPPAFTLPFTQVKAFRIGRSSVPSLLPLGQPHELGDEVGRVRELFPSLEQLAGDEALSFALRRFNDSNERARGEDAIVDCWSALEALFAAGSNQEVTFRVSLRAAKVLRETGEDRVELSRRMRRLYGTRSKVVHGTHVAPDRIAEDAAESKELLRAAILAWIEAGGYDGDALDALLLE